MAFARTTWVQDSPPYINAAQLNRIEQGIVDVTASAAAAIAGNTPPLVTALPASAADGTVVDLQTAAMATASLVWRFRYVAALANNKWVFLGGSEWRSKATATFTNSAPNAWEAMSAAVFPRFTVPQNGVYRIKFGTRFNTGTGVTEGYMGLVISPSVSPFDSMRNNTQGGTAGSVTHNTYETEVSLAAGNVIAGAHNTQTAVANVNYSGQFMLITPLAVSA